MQSEIEAQILAEERLDPFHFQYNIHLHFLSGLRMMMCRYPKKGRCTVPGYLQTILHLPSSMMKQNTNHNVPQSQSQGNEYKFQISGI